MYSTQNYSQHARSESVPRSRMAQQPRLSVSFNLFSVSSGFPRDHWVFLCVRSFLSDFTFTVQPPAPSSRLVIDNADLFIVLGANTPRQVQGACTNYERDARVMCVLHCVPLIIARVGRGRRVSGCFN